MLVVPVIPRPAHHVLLVVILAVVLLVVHALPVALVHVHQVVLAPPVAVIRPQVAPDRVVLDQVAPVFLVAPLVIQLSGWTMVQEI